MFSNKFVSATSNYCTFSNNVNAPYMRKTFEVKYVNKECNITICGLGFYRLFINGIEITKTYLAPYISNVDHIIYYDKYDLNKYLKKGKNVIGIILGNGMLNCVGGYTWWFDSATFRSAPKVAFALKVDDKIIEADETIKVHPSPITFDDLRVGEKYDANLEISNWNQIDFDDSKWDNAISAITPKGEKRICDIQPIIKSQEIKPTRIIKSENGYIYDFNYNSAGIIRLNIDAKKNQKIKLLHGEIVKNNKLDLTNIVFKKAIETSQCIIYTCKEGKQTYSPSFTYMGFQYVYVEGIDESQATEDLLTMLVMHTNIERISDFTCSNEDLNKIFKNTINSTKANFYHFPTDCPQREKNGWTGDAHFSANQMFMNFKVTQNLKEWLRNIKKAQLESGQIPGVVPTVEFGYSWGNGPAWDAVIVELPYRMYQYENNIEVFEENQEFIFKYLKYLESRLNEDGLACYGLGDWCQVEAPLPDKFTTPLCVTDTLISINIYKKASVLYKALNLKERYDYCIKMSNQLIKAFKEKCIDNNKEVMGKTQTGQAMAIYYKIFDKDEEKQAVDNLVGYIKNSDDHFDIGVLGSLVLFRALSEHGHDDLALKLITNKTFPSYSWQLKFNATSLWESFYNMDDNFNMYSDMTFEVLSMNHHFWGDVSSYFVEYIAGLKINEDCKDCNNVVIKPHLYKDISFAKAYHILPSGKVSVSWHKENGEFTLNVTIPENVKCKVIMPNNEEYIVTKTNSEYKVKIGD